MIVIVEPCVGHIVHEGHYIRDFKLKHMPLFKIKTDNLMHNIEDISFCYEFYSLIKVADNNNN